MTTAIVQERPVLVRLGLRENWVQFAPLVVVNAFVSGYVALAGSAALTAAIAARSGLRPDPFYPGVVFVALGLLLSAAVVRDTHGPPARDRGVV